MPDWKRVVSYFLNLGYDIVGEDSEKVVLSIPIYEGDDGQDWATVVVFKDGLEYSYITYETSRYRDGKILCGATGEWVDSDEECPKDYTLLKDVFPGLWN